MIQDAEKNAEADKEFQELVTLCNEAEHLVHSSRKAIKDAGDKLTSDESTGLEEKCKTLEEAIKEKSKDKIKTAKNSLNKQQLNQHKSSMQTQVKMLKERSRGRNKRKCDDTVVDADFKEVEDDKYILL